VITYETEQHSQLRTALQLYRCGGGKPISITYSECVFVALSIQHAMRMSYIVIRDLPGSGVFFHDFQKSF
jgi:hypothetical protein